MYMEERILGAQHEDVDKWTSAEINRWGNSTNSLGEEIY